MSLADEACVEHEPCVLCSHCLTCQHRAGKIAPYCLTPECAAVCRDEWPIPQSESDKSRSATARMRDRWNKQ